MKKNILISAIAVLFLSLVGCSKYEEGPALSLRTKTARVTNNWKVAQALENGSDVTPDYNKFELTMTKTGSASLSAEFTFFGTKYKYTTNGKWVFVSNKEKLSFDYDNDEADAVYTILKLKENEMWMKQDGSSLELHLVPR